MHSQAMTILGAGSWGSALALYLARLGQTVYLWSYERHHAAMLATDRLNRRYLPNHLFPDTLHPIANLAEAVSYSNDLLIAVPSFAFADTLTALKPTMTHPIRLICATKGLDHSTGRLLHQVTADTLGQEIPYAVLSGPSFAKEVASGLPTAIVIASQDQSFANELVARFNTDIFRVYTSTDVTGVEICGALKNVLAVATGISDGMGFGANARSALITRGLAEMTRLGVAMGGKLETFMGLAGVGDLVLTCTDNQSRNRSFGLALGKGIDANQAEKDIGQVIEGKKNAGIVLSLAAQYHIEMPITEVVWGILSGTLTPSSAMLNLVSRQPKIESN